jgi:hypothetical protein
MAAMAYMKARYQEAIMKKEIDLAQKLAGAIVRLEAAPKASPEIKLFMILDLAFPYELSVEDLESLTHLDRGTIGPAVATLTRWGYVQEKGGMLVRQR